MSATPATLGDLEFVAMREHGTGALSEAPVGATHYAVITVKDGKIGRFREFYDEATALEAAGLRGWAMSQENVEIVRRCFEAFLCGDHAEVRRGLTARRRPRSRGR